MILDVRGLAFAYRSHPVIDRVSFSVAEGEILTILGPNGAGKTTLLKCLNRILTPGEGAVLIDGEDAHGLGRNSIARTIGWVPQQGEKTRMTVYDLILMGRKPYFRWAPGREDHRKVEEALSLMDLEDLALRYADELSGGEFQMVQIVRALAQSPRVILFDEPTSSLDIAHQHHLMERIRSLIHGRSLSAVMTMHDINLALRYSDKFLLLKGGAIHAAGGREVITPETIGSVYRMDVHVTEACGYPLVIPR